MKHKSKKSKHVEVKHVEPLRARGSAHHREVTEDPTKTLGRVVSSEPSEPTASNDERDPDKMALFVRGGSGNFDAVPAPMNPSSPAAPPPSMPDQGE